MRKFISAIFVIVGIALLSAVAVYAEDTEMNISFGEAVRYDTAIKVPVIAENNIGMQSMHIGIECGSDDVELKAVEDNNIFSNAEFRYTISDDRAVITYTDDTYMYYANGVICTLVFIADDIENVTDIPLTFVDESTYVIDKFQDRHGCTVASANISVPQKYNVTFKTNGGSDLSDKACAYGSELSEEATREDYIFDGWYTDIELTNKFDGIVRSEITLYAAWTPEDRLIEGLTANIYNGKLLVDFSVYGENVSDENMIIVQINDKDGKVIAIKTQELLLSEKSTQEISMSFDANDFGTSDVEVSVMMWNPLSKAAPVTNSKRVEAKNAATVTLKNSDNSIIGTEYAEIGKTYMPTALEVDGKTFTGWTNSRGIAWNDSSVINDDITLFANYTTNEYTVTYYGETVTTETRAYGANLTQPKGMEGYTIEGWYTSDGHKWDFANDVVTADTELYSKWTANYYTVTFDTDDANETVDSQTVKYGGYASKPTSITKPQREFAGWYLDDTNWDFTTSKVIGDVTLKAKWTVNEYTVIFETDGGSSVEPITVKADETIDEPECVKDGCSLFGWYTEDGYKWDFKTDTITEVTTLHAEWYNDILDEYLVSCDSTAHIQYNNHQYQLFDFHMDWQDACDYCRLLGGHLAVISNAEENDNIVQLIQKGDSSKFASYFVGGTDEIEEGIWVWVNGETWGDYQPWADGEPTNKSGVGGLPEHYLTVRPNGKWNDLSNSETNSGFICEFEYIDSMNPIISDVQIVEQDITGYTIRCTVTDDSGIIKKVQFPTWTLYNGQDDIQSAWQINNGASGYKVANNIYKYRVNITDHNSELGAYKTHIYAYDGQGNVVAKGGCNVAILNKPVATMYYNGHIYERYDDKVGWEGSKSSCEILGGTLCSILNAEENDVVYNLASSGEGSNYWLGGSDTASEGNFVWVDGYGFSYSNWSEGEPNNSGEKQHYLQLYAHNSNSSLNGKWDDAYVTTKNGFICKYVNPKPEVEAIRNGKVYLAYKYDLSEDDIIQFVSDHKGTRVEIDADLSPDCKFAYEISMDNINIAKTDTYNNHTYMLINDAYLWHEAKMICEVLGGHLITINSAEENEFVYNLVKDFTDIKYCLMGGTDESKEGEFSWITGERMAYSNWNSEEPNNGGDQDYMQMYFNRSNASQNGKWDDDRNTVAKPFICEIE